MVVFSVFFYLFDVLIGGYIIGDHVGVGNGRMCVRVRDLFAAVCCRFRLRFRGGLSIVKQLCSLFAFGWNCRTDKDCYSISIWRRFMMKVVCFTPFQW